MGIRYSVYFHEDLINPGYMCTPMPRVVSGVSWVLSK